MTLRLERNYSFRHAPHRVFSAWTSPEHAIAPVSRQSFDVRPGGVIQLVCETPAGEFVMDGVFVEVAEDSFLRYTWEWSGDREHTEVLVRFEVDGDGSRVSLAQGDFLSIESLERHRSGWSDYCRRLDDRLTRDSEA